MRADAAILGEQDPSYAQALQAPVHSSPSRVARRVRGRPRGSRPAITVGNII